MSAYNNYYNYINGLHLSQLKSQLVLLNTSTKSTSIMTRLRHRHNENEFDINCKDPIDILYIRFSWKKYFSLLDLAVIYADPMTKEIVSHIYDEKTFSGDNNMTFTDLKKSHAWYWQDIEKGRLGERIQLDDEIFLHLWERPYNLYAVTEYDKDFRKEWRDGFLEYEGNEYGDTSDFYIIGSAHKQKQAI